jgi:hypothetical protein
MTLGGSALGLGGGGAGVVDVTKPELPATADPTYPNINPVPSASAGVAHLASGGPAGSAKPESDVSTEKGPVVHFGPVPSASAELDVSTEKGGPVVHFGPVPSASAGVAHLASGGPAGSAKPESDVSMEKGPVVHFGPVR